MPSVSTSFTTFGTAARAGSIGGSESWGTASHAQANDSDRATYNTNALRPWSGHTLYLTASQIADLVPDGATIDGIQATVVRRRSASGIGAWKDSAVHVIKGGTVQTAQNKASATNYTTTDASENYGGPTDKWGLEWTAADINAAGFGIAVSCGTTGMDMEDGDSPQINAVTVEVFYTEPASATKNMMLTGCGE